MARKTLHVLIYGIIALAIIGIFSELFTNALNFVTSILIMIGVAALIFGAFYFIFLRNKGSSTTSEMKKYRQAVKQSKRKYKNHGKSTSKPTKLQTTRGRKKVRRRPHHLRVIEGNKSKRKKRASN
ncbi:MAG TPA: SA1362 family protein [Bacillota bacterium]|nr:SA1362 family protein [Bacillota bacterium]